MTLRRMTRHSVLVVITLLALLCFDGVYCRSSAAPKLKPTPTATAPFGIVLPDKKPALLELTFNSTIVWICALFFVVWALVQLFQFVANRGYTEERGMVPHITLHWTSLFKLSYNSQSDDIRRKINAYFIKGVIYPLGLAFSAYSLGVLYGGDNLRKFSVL
jgi:hypothetical protein